MNKDTIKGKWHQIKGRVKQQWGRLTNDDLRRMEGNIEVATGLLQERYGHSKEVAEHEWKAFCERCDADDKVTGTNNQEV